MSAEPKLRLSYPRLVWKDFLFFFRICRELWRGFHFLRGSRQLITVFGSARLPSHHPYCVDAKALSARLAKDGYSIVTGGGGSLMEAANQGAFESRTTGDSIGINIEIPNEQKINAYVTRGFKSRYFFVRKLLLSRYSDAFLIFPGGFGTLDEFFEIITLIQTKKMEDCPIILIGPDFWAGLIAWCNQTLLPLGMISPSDLSRLRIATDIDEAYAYLTKALSLKKS